MDDGFENQNEVNINAPIVVDETENVNFDHKLETDHPSEKPQTPNEGGGGGEEEEGLCCKSISHTAEHLVVFLGVQTFIWGEGKRTGSQ